MQQQNLISVIIPAYNAGDTIRSCLESIINQTLKENIEIVVVNDGSTDNTVGIVEEIISSNNSSRLIRLISKENGGVSSARNLGLKRASGEYLAFLDADDFWYSDKLEKQMELFERYPKVKFIGCNRRNYHYNYFGKKTQRIFTISLYNMLFKWWPSTSTVIMHREIIGKVGYFNENLNGSEDADYWVRVLTNDFMILTLNEELVDMLYVKRTYGEKGLSSNLGVMFDGELFIVNDLYQKNKLNTLGYYFFKFWVTAKYYRRIAICKLAGFRKELLCQN